VTVHVANFGDYLDVDISKLCRAANRRQGLFDFVPHVVQYSTLAAPALPPHYRFRDVWAIVCDPARATIQPPLLLDAPDQLIIWVTNFRLAEQPDFRDAMGFPTTTTELTADCYGVWVDGPAYADVQKNSYVASTYLFRKLLASDSYRTVYQYLITDITSFLCQRLSEGRLYHYETRWDIFDYSDDTEEFIKGLKLSYISRQSREALLSSSIRPTFASGATPRSLLEAAERLLSYSRKPTLAQVFAFIYRSTFFSTVVVVGLFSMFNGLAVALITESERLLLVKWMAATVAPVIILVVWMRVRPFGELRS
jgi:hypothetical protein